MTSFTVRNEFEIAPATGEVFEVEDGELVRIVAVEGPQAADLIAFNTHDYRETLSTWLTRHMSGSFLRADRAYTKLPSARVMFEILTDRAGLLWLSPGRCNRLSYQHVDQAHLSCQDILEKCVQRLGLSPFDVPEVLNIFMNPEMSAEGTYRFGPSPVEPGDAFEMIAQMDSTIAVSACPDDYGDYNEFQVRPLGIQVCRLHAE